MKLETAKGLPMGSQWTIIGRTDYDSNSFCSNKKASKNIPILSQLGSHNDEVEKNSPSA